MGTCSGKGVTVTVSVKDALWMKKIGVPSIDDFIDKVNEIVEQFSAIVDPLAEKNAKIIRLNGFRHIAGATIRHALEGMFLSFGTAVEGDYNKLKLKFEDSPPYIKLSLHGVSTNDLIEAFEVFCEYISELETILLEKLPKLVETSMELVEAVKGVVENAKGEIEGLGTFEKIKAAAKAPLVAIDVAKIPGEIKKKIEDFKQEILDTKDAIQAVKDLDKISANAKKCVAAKKYQPVECYKHIHGEIGKAKPTKK